MEIGLPDLIVLQVIKPLYGIPESGLHWYLTYLEYHIDELKMVRTKADTFFLIKRNDEGIEGMVLLQVDDSLGVGTEGFLEKEEKWSQRFRSKDRKIIGREGQQFNGTTFRLINGGLITIT